MATIVNKQVGGGTNDYSSVSLWEAGEQGDLVTADQIRQAEVFSFSDTTAVTIDGSTTDATRYLRVYATTGSEAQMPWSTSVYRLNPASNTTPLTISDLHVRIERIQIQLTTGASARFGVDVGNFSGVRIVGCHIRATGSGAGAQVGIRGTVSGAGNTIHIRNSFVVGFNTTGISCSSGSGESYVYNNTVVNCGTGITGGGAMRAKNNLTYNNTTDFSGTFHASSTNNASEDGTAPNTNEVTISADPFVNAAGENWHLATGTQAVDVGTDLSGDSSFPFSDDFDGVARTGTWDVGADEFVAAASGSGEGYFIITS